MKGGNCLFYYLCSKIIYMTFEEAISLVERIRNQVVDAPVKGRFIESLFIGPTNWDEMKLLANLSGKASLYMVNLLPILIRNFQNGT